MPSPTHRTQLLVLGAGPGGYGAAFLAGDRGLDVVLVNEDAAPGGVCLHRGCIPSKALLHLAHVVETARDAEQWGLTFAEPAVDLEKVRAWKDKTVGNLIGGLSSLCKLRGIDYRQGWATFVDAQTVRVEGPGEGTFAFDNCLIATGSEPVKLPFMPNESHRVLDSTSALALKEIPESLLIVGGGYIGLELGTVYAALGSTVTVVELTDGLLPGCDRDLVRPLQKRVAGLLDSILLNTKVAAVKETRTGLEVSFEGEGAPASQSFDRVLVAVGRRPRGNGFGLENTGIALNERGFIPVNETRQTVLPHLYALGDVAGEPMLAHKATREGKVAVEAILGEATVFDPRAIPAVVFTDPEIAWCGLTETQAKAQGLTVETAKFPWSASGRALTMGRPDGLTKLVFEPETHVVLGVGLAGVGAGELIAEGVLAVEFGATAEDLAMSIHPHPTRSETVAETAEGHFGQSTHYRQPDKH